MKKLRLKYAVIFLILLGIEICIALFVHDNFIRPYIGDILVVMVIYYFIRIFIADGLRCLPLYVFLLAFFVELLQYFEIVKHLGLDDSTFFRILIGSVFDIKDIICYLIGCIILAVIQQIKVKKAVEKR